MKSINIQDLLIWEDRDFFAVNKPPFIATLEDRSQPVNLLSLAREYHPDAQACHRLDKETSGVIIFARNPGAYRHLSLQFQHREVTKIYHAVVDGRHEWHEKLVDAPIAKNDDGTVSIRKYDGKPAQTWFTTLQLFRNHSLLECRPITGRMHQIRIHLTLLQAPITGDVTYGGKVFYLSSVKRGYNLKKQEEEQPLMKRMALHAKSLVFKDMNQNLVTAEADYPKDLHALVRQLSLNG
ncbi:MAG: RNA pseudouridine synthase [Cyclobacteriaceae bacterium]|nr:RNA pseudouridine synthase [Cyclobacteriaceae bacterium]